MDAVRIGTRGSDLARWQTGFVSDSLRAAHPGLALEIIEIRSVGDELPEVPLEHLEGIGFFTSSLERALLAGEIDVAVHSFKDLPVDSSPDLAVVAVPGRAPVEDALCARDGLTLAQLPAGARIGTSSTRRHAQLRALRRDIVLEPLRGNVPTRVRRVAATDLDGVVLACAGLGRLGLAGHITEVFSLEHVLPAPAQGALAVQARRADTALAQMLRAIDDAAARHAVEAERELLHALGGGCAVPVAAHATVIGDVVHLRAGVFDPHDLRAVRATIEARHPVEAGQRAARQLLEQGAGEILAAFAKTPRLGPESL